MATESDRVGTTTPSGDRSFSPPFREWMGGEISENSHLVGSEAIRVLSLPPTNFRF
ncbi:MAG: hypothetical protein ACP5D7_17555 [Limnospira sp.]